MSCQKFRIANVLRRPRQRDTSAAYTVCEASDNVELQSCQLLSVSVHAETRIFREESEVAAFTTALWVCVVDLLESLV